MITTFTGKQFDVFEPQIELICIEDIAHALAYTCRFGGHCNQFYSVAEHSIIAANIFEGCRSTLALAALLHDAAEAYLGDMPGPIKSKLPDFKVAEDTLIKKIFLKFGAVYEVDVKQIDRCLLWWEAGFLLPNRDEIPSAPALVDVVPFFFTPQEAEQKFLQCFYQLWKNQTRP